MWVPIGVKYHIPMELFYSLNPKKILRDHPYMDEWNKNHHDEESRNGWVNGLYVQRAVGSVLSRNGKYLDEPLTLYRVEGEEAVEEETYTLTDADRFFGFATMFNKAHEKQFREHEIIDVVANDVADATDDIE